MAFAEFEEKQFECAFNVELGASGSVFAAGQMLEELTGYDMAADVGPRHNIWRVLASPRPAGIRLVPDHWAPTARRLRPAAPRLPQHVVSLIVQFKRPEYLHGSTAAQYGFWHQPYFRFTRRALQHRQLRRLELNVGGAARVVYAAPAFHRYAELETAQMRGTVVDSTGFVSPSRMGRHATWTYVAPGTMGRGNPDGEEMEFAVFESLFARVSNTGGKDLVAQTESVPQHLRVLAQAVQAVSPELARYARRWAAGLVNVADVPEEMVEPLRDFAMVQSFVAMQGGAWWLLNADELAPLIP